MGQAFRKLFDTFFGNSEMRVVMLGLDAAGKTTILYKLHIGEVMSAVPTIENIESEAKLVVMRDDDVKMTEKSVDDVKMTEKSVGDVKMTEKCVNDELHDTSMRKLTMMLKEKLEITKKTSKNESVDDVKMTEKSVDDVKMTEKSVVDVKMTVKSVGDVKMTEKCVNDELHDTSMRKLTMMLKEKLEITKKTSKNESVDDVKMNEKSVADMERKRA